MNMFMSWFDFSFCFVQDFLFMLFAMIICGIVADIKKRKKDKKKRIKRKG